ncbi:MAG: S1C family serine protease, partial [Chloroflexota bacterium]
MDADSVLTPDLAAPAETLRRATVQVRTERRGSGSGVIWRSDGLVVTNAHVVRGPRATIELSDGREFTAEVTHSDVRRDLAALRVPARDLPALEIGDSSRLRVGQLVIAVGNPLGLSGALSAGIIHAIAPASEHGSQEWVQADVRLLPGNSGGPLADVLGRVIGINSMVAGGLGLAVPSNAVSAFLGSHAAGPRLGITTQPVRFRLEQESAVGLLVLATDPHGAGAKAGLMIGDVVVGSRGRLFTQSEDPARILAFTGAERTIQLEILRGGRRLSQAIELEPPAGEIGTE